jgi:hypothetical protein
MFTIGSLFTVGSLFTIRTLVLAVAVAVAVASVLILGSWNLGSFLARERLTLGDGGLGGRVPYFSSPRFALQLTILTLSACTV